MARQRTCTGAAVACLLQASWKLKTGPRPCDSAACAAASTMANSSAGSGSATPAGRLQREPSCAYRPFSGLSQPDSALVHAPPGAG